MPKVTSVVSEKIRKKNLLKKFDEKQGFANEFFWHYTYLMFF